MYVQYTPHTHSINSGSEDRKTQFGIQTINQKMSIILPKAQFQEHPLGFGRSSIVPHSHLYWKSELG
jgi:hypothetical protein